MSSEIISDWWIVGYLTDRTFSKHIAVYSYTLQQRWATFKHRLAQHSRKWWRPGIIYCAPIPFNIVFHNANKGKMRINVLDLSRFCALGRERSPTPPLRSLVLSVFAGHNHFASFEGCKCPTAGVLVTGISLYSLITLVHKPLSSFPPDSCFRFFFCFQ